MSRLHLFFFVLISALSTAAIATDPDDIYTPQRAFSGATLHGLAYAGTALPSGVESGFLNPALVYSWRKELDRIHSSAVMSYGRDSLFDRHIVSAAGSYSTQEGALGLFYRYLMDDKDRNVSELSMVLAGQMFENNDEQGPVDFGMSVRFEKSEWALYDVPALPVSRLWRDSTGVLLADTVIDTVDAVDGKIRENRLVLDAGFFQRNVAPNLDFSFVMRNLAGYRWRNVRPQINETDSVVNALNPDSVEYLTIREYTDEYDDDNGWLKSAYRTMTLGIAYRIGNGEGFEITLPADIEMLGFFDKGVKNRFSFHGGIQVGIKGNYFLRFGYSRAPGVIPAGEKNIKNVNAIAGGAGLRIDILKADFAIDKNGWGFTVGFDF